MYKFERNNNLDHKYWYQNAMFKIYSKINSRTITISTTNHNIAEEDFGSSVLRTHDKPSICQNKS